MRNANDSKGKGGDKQPRSREEQVTGCLEKLAAYVSRAR